MDFIIVISIFVVIVLLARLASLLGKDGTDYRQLSHAFPGKQSSSSKKITVYFKVYKNGKLLFLNAGSTGIEASGVFSKQIKLDSNGISVKPTWPFRPVFIPWSNVKDVSYNVPTEIFKPMPKDVNLPKGIDEAVKVTGNLGISFETINIKTGDYIFTIRNIPFDAENDKQLFEQILKLKRH